MKPQKVQGLTIVELVEILDAYGFKNLAGIENIPPNPLLWNKNQWNFAVSVVAAGLKIPKSEVRQKFRKAGEILQVFNETLRKTGLIIELQQITKISEKELLRQLKTEPQWDEEWVNE